VRPISPKTAALVGLVLLAAAPRLALTDEAKPSDYVQLVQRYARGDRAAIVVQIAAWPESRLKSGTKTLLDLAPETQIPASPRSSEARRAADLWKAALLLHMDAASRLRSRRRSPKAQMKAALRFAERPEDDANLGRFVARWYLAVAAEAQVRAAWREAFDLAREGLKRFPDALDLQLVVASVEETRASLVIEHLPDSVFSDPYSLPPGPRPPRSGDARRHLERAHEALLAVVAVQPGHIDARLRLGRVAWRLGRAEEARQSFEAALKGAQPAQSYLARLFLGQLLEEEGQLEAAVREYARAIALEPQSQPARVALSQVQLRLGNPGAARVELARALTPAGRRRSLDPFWAYPWGLATRSQALLSALRKEVAP
jgi:tetratricopeptide (TPR) repeat protein